MYSFLQYEYSYHHVKMASACRSHYCTFAVNKEVTPENNGQYIPSSYKACSHPCIFFGKLNLLINHLIQQAPVQARLEDHKEMKSMLKASKEIFQPAVILCMARRVRATAQFAKIKKEVSLFSEETGSLWMDHKQKIILMWKQEGQIEYFGKREMSLLSGMLARHELRIANREEISGLVYYFYDVIVDNYSS